MIPFICYTKIVLEHLARTYNNHVAKTKLWILLKSSSDTNVLSVYVRWPNSFRSTPKEKQFVTVTKKFVNVFRYCYEMFHICDNFFVYATNYLVAATTFFVTSAIFYVISVSMMNFVCVTTLLFSVGALNPNRCCCIFYKSRYSEVLVWVYNYPGRHTSRFLFPQFLGNNT